MGEDDQSETEFAQWYDDRINEPDGDIEEAAPQTPAEPQPERTSQTMNLAEIQALRSSDKRAYYSPAVQARELALLGDQAPVASTQDQPWWETQDTTQDVPQDAGEENGLIAVADLPPELALAGEFVGSVLAEDAMSTETIEAFTTELTTAAQDALVAEMSQSPDTDAGLATDEQLAAFTATLEGESMVEEWGDRAAEKLGVVSQRYNRLRNNLPSHERETFDDLFDELPPSAIEQVYRRLAG